MKRLISVLLTVIMVGTALCIPDLAADDEYWKREDNLSIDQAIWKTDSYKLGDVNGDGTVNALDAFTIVSYVTKFTSELNMSAADIDADGKVTAKDNFYFKASAAGICSIDDFENGQRVYKFTIAGNDISEYSLVLPADANYNDNIYFAYELLLKYIQKMTGVTLPKVYGDYDGKAIRLHSVAMDSELGEKLGDDGYEYIVKDGNLEIYGAIRGNMYAAYDILEKYLGLFFCNNTYTHSEKLRTSDIPEGTDFYFNTPTVNRFCMHTIGHERTSPFYGLARHQNNLVRALEPESYYGYYCGSQFLNAHSFWYYKCMGEGIMPEEGTLNADGTVVMSLADRYYQKFLNGGGTTITDANAGQPCASDDEVFETLYSGMLDVIEMLKARGKVLNFGKNRHMLSFSINDNLDFCTCTMCNAKTNGGTMRMRGNQSTHLQSYCGDYTLDGKSVTFKKESHSGTYLAMINRAADRIKEIYPDVQIFSILYDGTVPESVRPRENMVLCYCDNISGCSKCRLSDSDKCSPINSDTHSTKRDAEAISNWGKICRETGAQLYSWYYPENYTYYIVDLPKFFDIYYDIKWMCEQGVVGFYYEGVQSSGPEYTLCDMNAFLASEVMWNPSMTFDEYVALMKKYLRVKYGAGYEHMYNYICILDTASEPAADNCCGAYYYRPFDIYSKSYLNEHYEEMRAEIMAAIDECDNPDCMWNLNNMLMNCEFLGLSAAHDRLYTNGDAASRALYEERYTWLYNYIRANVSKLTGSENAGTFFLPGSISFDKSPLVQIYKGERRWS